MALRDDVPALVQHYLDNKCKLAHNETLFNIYEGDLLTYVLQDLKRQLSAKSYEQIAHRVPPINILKRLIDKLSKIYAKPPLRTFTEPSDQDTELLTFYEKAFDVNTTMGAANEFFNLFKTGYVEPYLYQGKPQLRVIPSDRCLPYSNDAVNPQQMTHFIKVMGTLKRMSYDAKGVATTSEDRTILYLYSDLEFLAVDDHGEVIQEIMQREDIAKLGGENPFGKIPFIYVNRSRYMLIPIEDTDTLAMTKLIPILLADANFAAMFQAFSIIYGIDLDEEGLTMSPNAFWRFKSDPAKPNSKPEVGIIKPELDTDKMLALIKAELSLWLQSRNIKPGAMGELTLDRVASGIAKAIDEMDTSEDRQKQIPFFIKAESDLWDFVINHAHPIWMRDADFQNKMPFSPGAEVNTQFAEQKPLINYSQIIDDVVKKRDERLIDVKRALREIYPDDSDAQIDQRIADIQADKTFVAKTVSVAPIPNSANNPGNDPAAAGAFN